MSAHPGEPRTILPRRLPHHPRLVSRREKYAYARGGDLWIILIGLVSALLLLIGLCRFAATPWVWAIAVPFLLVNGVYLALSFGVMLSGRRFRLAEHERLCARWDAETNRLRQTTVDVFLPVCGEPREHILAAWAGVRELRWPGPLNIHVLDDSPSDDLREAAARHGFNYLRRGDRALRKAGNLRHAFARTSGDFILLLDADFRPRPEMLLELIPYLLEEERLAIVQSPQFFDVERTMGWVQAGAGYVQELFYRLIQPARDRWGAAVCVGSCAVYRRAALDEIGGAPEIDHSEDLWTGFQLLQRGWRVRYVPLVLAKGLCPDRLGTFYSQQYRWCRGSLSLIGSREFWQARLPWSVKLCFLSGFAYYIAAAVNVVLTPFPPLTMVCLFPDFVHWSHLAFSILTLVYTPFLIGLWSRYPFGVHFLTTREVSGAAHLNAVIDGLQGRMQDWVVSGGLRPAARAHGPLACLLASSGLAAAAIWLGALRALALAPERWFHFVPPVLFSSLHAGVCWRAFPSAWGIWLSQVEQWRTSPQRSRPFARPLLRLAGAFAAVAVVLTLFLRTGTSTSTETVAIQQAGFGNFDIPASRFDAPARNFPLDGLQLSATADLSEWTVVNAFPGLELPGVMRLREHPRQPGISYAASQDGVIRSVQNQKGIWTSRVVADLSESDLHWLMSFEFHPQFPRDPRLFLISRALQADQYVLRVSQLKIPSSGVAGPAQETVLIEQQLGHDDHLGGDLAFDDTGCLLVSVGDNSPSHEDRNSQRIDGDLLSGILRIDVDRRGGAFSRPPPRQPLNGATSGYFIPHTNPFVGQPGVLEEFWALGLRNPFRIFYDAPRARLWIGDVGEDRREQLELAAAGTNHLWSYREGTLPYDRSHLRGQPPDPLSGRPVDPLLEYPHEDLNFCVIGGLIYQGEKFPQLRGRYLFGDNRSGRVWALDPRRPQSLRLLMQLPFTRAGSSLVSLGSDRAGNIFFTNFATRPGVYALTRSDQVPLPELLSQTGIFQDLTSRTPRDGFISYDVASPLWSDGLAKRRWFRLPSGAQIDNGGEIENWKFAAGTILVKHFDRPALARQAPGPVETRVLIVRTDGQTIGASYLWDSDGADARLQRERSTLSLPSDDGAFAYHVPSPQDCRVCHNPRNPVLGLRADQLNLDRSDLAPDQNQLVALSRRGVFTRPYSADDAGWLPRLASLHDDSAPLDRRARSYLQSNCSFCHFPDGVEHIDLDLRLTNGPGVETLLGKPARLRYHVIDEGIARQIIAPGRPEESALFRRLRTRDRTYAMPYLGRTRADPQALDVIERWIESLESTIQPP